MTPHIILIAPMYLYNIDAHNSFSVGLTRGSKRNSESFFGTIRMLISCFFWRKRSPRHRWFPQMVEVLSELLDPRPNFIHLWCTQHACIHMGQVSKSNHPTANDPQAPGWGTGISPFMASSDLSPGLAASPAVSVEEPMAPSPRLSLQLLPSPGTLGHPEAVLQPKREPSACVWQING